jgi:purine-binding chemotaxis protein CheW
MEREAESPVLKQERDESLVSLEEMLYEGARLYEDKEVREEKRQWIVFRLHREYYGIEISKIKEILKRPKITPLPFGPPWISGVTNFRGNILSVTDLKRVLGLPKEEGVEETKMIVVESGSMETGVLVDEVLDSVEVSIDQMEPLPHLLREEMEGVLEGAWRWGEKWVGLVHIEKLLEKGSEGRDEESSIWSVF